MLVYSVSLLVDRLMTPLVTQDYLLKVSTHNPVCVGFKVLWNIGEGGEMNISRKEKKGKIVLYTILPVLKPKLRENKC